MIFKMLKNMYAKLFSFWYTNKLVISVKILLHSHNNEKIEINIVSMFCLYLIFFKKKSEKCGNNICFHEN